MAKFIKTRDQNQCRGHYHKTLASLKTNAKIIEEAKKFYPNYEEYRERMLE